MTHIVTDETEDSIVQPSNNEILTTINSLGEYLHEIHELSIKPKEEKKKVVYRGQPNKTFRLIPKLGRIVTKKMRMDNPSIESDLFFKFKAQYFDYCEKIIDNNLDFLIIAQHYGLPTRFLDWTFDPLVALYFACQEVKRAESSSFFHDTGETNNELESKNIEDGADGAVFIRVMAGNIRFKELHKRFDPLKTQLDRMILPGFHDKRIFVQKGILELFKNPYKSSKLPVLKKIIIPQSVKKEILSNLEDLHYSKLDLFPTLDNLSESIIKEMI